MSKLTDVIQKMSGSTIEDVQLLEAFTNKSFAGKSEGEVLSFFAQNGTTNPEILAETIKNAFTQVSKILQYSASFKNPLMDVFYKGDNPMGGRIESIATDVADIQSFRSAINTNPYELFATENHAQYYTYKLDRTSAASVIATQANMFFNSPEQVNEFVYAQIESVYNAHVLEQYYYQKLMFVAALMYGQVKYGVGGNPEDLVFEIGNVISQMTNATNAFNKRITYAMERENAVIVMSAETSNRIAVKYQAVTFNQEIASELFSGAKRVVIDSFPDIWLYAEDHTVTADDVEKGFVSVAKDSNGLGLSVGSVIPAGSLAYPGATGAGIEDTAKPGTFTPTFSGSIIQAYICDVDHIIYSNDLPITVTSYVNPRSRAVQIVGHSKLSLAINTNRNGIALLASAPTITDDQGDSLDD